MFNRTWILLAAFWATTLAPALCSADLIHHDCPCHQESCSHEVDCDNDPCDQLAKVTNGWRPHSVLDAGLECLPAIVEAVPAIGLRAALAVLVEALPPPIPVVHNSDLPLLL